MNLIDPRGRLVEFSLILWALAIEWNMVWEIANSGDKNALRYCIEASGGKACAV